MRPYVGGVGVRVGGRGSAAKHLVHRSLSASRLALSILGPGLERRNLLAH